MEVVTPFFTITKQKWTNMQKIKNKMFSVFFNIVITLRAEVSLLMMMMMIMNLYSAKTIEEYSKALYIKLKLMNK